MSLIICTREDESNTLAHGLVVCTQEQADDYLMHWRTRGSKNGVRRWQDTSGRLTPEGYQHYAEMYGWGKKLKKAKSLQNEADKKTEKAESVMKRSDEAIAKAYYLEKKNARHTTERNQSKADKANETAEKINDKAALARIDARKAREKATDYADKLQRKEDRMSKYVDENGDLNEKAMKKYAYDSLTNPGEKKMSLIGRLKFGKEYTDKFNEEHKMKMTKEEYKEWEKKENEKFDKMVENEKKGAELNYIAEKFDNLGPENQKKAGDEILDYCGKMYKEIGDRLKNGEKLDRDDYVQYDELQSWITERVYDKSGSWNAGYFDPKSNAGKVYPKLEKAYKDAGKHQERVEEILGIDRKGKGWQNEEKRLWNALKSDSYYQALDKAVKDAESDLLGAILEDMGFSNTSQNRSILMPFAFLD